MTTARLEPATGRIVTPEMLAGVPPVVRRYLNWAGVVGQSMPGSMALRQAGRIRPGTDQPWWPFTADQSFLMGQPAFRWLAHVRVRRSAAPARMGFVYRPTGSDGGSARSGGRSGQRSGRGDE